MKDIGKLIYDRRKELKMTQSQLAEELDVSDKTVSRWELNISMPETNQIPYLAKALNLKVSDFFSEDDVVLNKQEDIKEAHKEVLRFKVLNAVLIGVIFLMALFGFLTFYFKNLNQTDLFFSFKITTIVIIVAGFVLAFIANLLFSSFYKNKYREGEYIRMQLEYALLDTNAFFISLGIIFLGFYAQSKTSGYLESRSYLFALLIPLAFLINLFILSKENYRLELRGKKEKTFLIIAIVFGALSLLLPLIPYGPFAMIGLACGLVYFALLIFIFRSIQPKEIKKEE